MLLLLTILTLTAIVVWYALGGRTWLKGKPWMSWLYQSWFGEWIETKIFKKSETVLVARYSQFLGLVLTLLGFAGEIDWTLVSIITPDYIDPYLPLMPTVLNFVGAVFEKLRNSTTQPIEVVAAPEAVKAALPEVKEMQDAKVAAVIAVETAKVEGKTT